jgi:hypothetical protein
LESKTFFIIASIVIFDALCSQQMGEGSREEEARFRQNILPGLISGLAQAALLSPLDRALYKSLIENRFFVIKINEIMTTDQEASPSPLLPRHALE